MATFNDPVVEVIGLTKRYGSHVALDGLDLDVHRGEVFGLLGVSGAGKTTLVECAQGPRRPDAGSCGCLVWIPSTTGTRGHVAVRDDPGALSFASWVRHWHRRQRSATTRAATPRNAEKFSPQGDQRDERVASRVLVDDRAFVQSLARAVRMSSAWTTSSIEERRRRR